MLGLSGKGGPPDPALGNAGSVPSGRAGATDARTITCATRIHALTGTGYLPAMPPRRRLRLKDPLRYERDWWEIGIELVAGVDEVGRGPLAGPVVAAAVILPVDVRVKGASDSKLLSAEMRIEVDAEVRSVAAAVGVGAASAAAIDLFGITAATRAALKRALDALPIRPGHVILDGRPVRGLGWEHRALPKADYRVHCVACASVVAKVCR